SWITRQNSDVHADAIFSQAQEPFHSGAGKVRAARRGVDSRTDARAHDTTIRINEIAIETRVMVRIFFEHVHVAGWRTVAALARGNWPVGSELFAHHQIRALFRDRHHDTRVIGRKVL